MGIKNSIALSAVSARNRNSSAIRNFINEFDFNPDSRFSPLAYFSHCHEPKKEIPEPHSDSGATSQATAPHIRKQRRNPMAPKPRDLNSTSIGSTTSAPPSQQSAAARPHFTQRKCRLNPRGCRSYQSHSNEHQQHPVPKKHPRASLLNVTTARTQQNCGISSRDRRRNRRRMR